MFIQTLAAAAANAAPQNKFGFVEALQAGGFISYATVTILGIMSFGSFFILFTKYFEQAKILGQYKALANFWRAPTLREGAAKLDKNSAWRQLVDDGIAAEDQHAKMTDSLEAHDWLHGSLARSEASINARLAGGLPFLATVGATAPFIGLFGTVVGIYRALIAIGLAGSASIDKVAGPVGEALIMTALGLLVAVPAVLAYNWLQSRNKKIAELLQGFSTDVLANITSKGAVKPAVGPAPAAKPAAPVAAPVKK
ncbi:MULTISPECIES: MotA/TolQ/ExbB proton channel family protein [Novosphingobium]|uniref:MotA/TolQ/ExbB proton channel family protein n=1 Tax=Novosphingobium TaxID=165696 RepID=UPI0003B4B222|nr:MULTISPECIES: MotA/TolQ/ExbB proton channel family protein [Novosphingobium]KPF51911.1 flagellar motor protein MotA [Novosphingobium sp. AAP1]MBB3360053.1 biopolymer transport protein ExbB [Novosphingobium sp. BK256]MBB3376458.1 biopolymer transport protein ExbB [Novosphingobium sp. BK280]MBB3380826.1 biopolymer transport protein ExbB [Novosphingobium sp. BK258]MBB3422522.1 biopolymer transport protein ExbB [Novosphingobium sp. BK267]